MNYAAAFARLCVETIFFSFFRLKNMAAAFARLCVETISWSRKLGYLRAAAFARLCVETAKRVFPTPVVPQPPSRGCVLKQEPLTAVKDSAGRSRLRAAVC